MTKVKPRTIDLNYRMTDDEFWHARPWLWQLRRYALDIYASPWTVLGCVLARQAALVPPTVRTASMVSEPGSLNYLVALVGGSGEGKSESNNASRRMLNAPSNLYFESLAGTGEGMAEMYLTRERDPKTKEMRYRQARDSALLYVDEIGQLEGLMGRSGSVLGSTLRTMFTGGAIGSNNAKAENSRRVDAHKYRFAAIIGVQPRLAGVLIHDNGAGTPQRILWMPAAHPDIATWKRLDLDPPGIDCALPHGDVMITYAPVIFRAIDKRKRARTWAGTLDAHRDWLTMKTAALLALLDGQTHVTVELWRLASYVLDVSARTRDAVLGELDAAAREEGARRGAVLAAQTEVIDRQRAVRSTTRAKVLAVLADGEWHPSRDLTTTASKGQRAALGSVLTDMLDAGEVKHEQRATGGRPGDFYRAVS